MQEDRLLNSFARNHSAHVLFPSVREDLRQEDLPFSSRKINAVAPEMEAFELLKGERADGLSRWSGLFGRCSGEREARDERERREKNRDDP